MTRLATDWSCTCGRTNKSAWRICPDCGHRPGAADDDPPQRSRRARAVLAWGVSLALVVAAVAVVRPLVSRDDVGERSVVSALEARPRPAAKEAAAHAALGRRLVAPGKRFRASTHVAAGPLTPEAVAAAQPGGVTAAQLRAGGLSAGYTASWSGPGGQLLVVVLHEFTTPRGMQRRVDAQIAALRASYGPRPREVPPQVPGARGVASDGPLPGGSYAVAVVTAGQNRMATVTLLTKERPGTDDITSLLTVAAAQDARL